MQFPNTINYLEIPARDLALTKQFYSQAFGWTFLDSSLEYCCFTNAGINGAFFRSSRSASIRSGGVLLVLYSPALETSAANVIAAGGKITQAIFSFPGGRRFHFQDPNGNELAVWSK